MEYAARAGSNDARYGSLDTIAWYDRTSGSKTHDVAQKLPNAWGLYDMFGNVAEWTADWYVDDSYKAEDQTDPLGPAIGRRRAMRVGSWAGPLGSCGYLFVVPTLQRRPTLASASAAPLGQAADN